MLLRADVMMVFRIWIFVDDHGGNHNGKFKKEKV